MGSIEKFASLPPFGTSRHTRTSCFGGVRGHFLFTSARPRGGRSGVVSRCATGLTSNISEHEVPEPAGAEQRSCNLRELMNQLLLLRKAAMPRQRVVAAALKRAIEDPLMQEQSDSGGAAV